MDRNRLKKFMQVGIDVKCMHTNFGGRSFSGFRDINVPLFLFVLSMNFKLSFM